MALVHWGLDMQRKYEHAAQLWLPCSGLRKELLLCVFVVCLFKRQMFQQLLVLYLMLRFLNILHIADENICYNFCTDLFCLYGM